MGESVSEIINDVAAGAGIEGASVPIPLPEQEPKVLPRSGLGMPTRSGHVLIVDDLATIRLMLARHVRELGHQVTLSGDGRDALKLLGEQSFDLVLLDMMMPGMDGYAVLKQIKEDPGLREIPVVMISGVDDIKLVTRCIEIGAEDYLPKPFEPALLRARVRACLDKKQMWDELETRYRQLKDLEQLRDSLTYMIVHDLRTPAYLPSHRPANTGSYRRPGRDTNGDVGSERVRRKHAARHDQRPARCQQNGGRLACIGAG